MPPGVEGMTFAKTRGAVFYQEIIMQTKSADRTPMLRTARTLAFACMLPALAMTTAHAESTADAQANYQKQKADCMSGQTAEGKKTCLREAAAALNDAKNGRLDKGKFNSNFEANARRAARCSRMRTTATCANGASVKAPPRAAWAVAATSAS